MLFWAARPDVGRRPRRRQRDGSILSRGDRNVFSHLARTGGGGEKLRRFLAGIERVFARAWVARGLG
ncbi:hypothetical protein C6P87_07715, partial [Burkholderia sp. AU12872]